jgi:DNA mismatch repair ATPase MutS
MILAFLVKQLSKTWNLGFVSTHDLELGEMENHKNSKIKNYHFSKYYRENEVHFDYKLKVGVSPTRNAVYLMKLADIEIEETNEVKVARATDLLYRRGDKVPLISASENG